MLGMDDWMTGAGVTCLTEPMGPLIAFDKRQIQAGKREVTQDAANDKEWMERELLYRLGSGMVWAVLLSCFGA